MNRINQSEIGLLSQNIVCSHAISQRNTCSNINKTFADLGVTFPIEKLVYWHISTWKIAKLESFYWGCDAFLWAGYYNFAHSVFGK